MYDPADSEKVANAALHQRAAAQAVIEHLYALLDEIEYLVEGRVDIDKHGGPNLAMQIKSVLSRK